LTAKNTFLPIGYFISRIVAHKVKNTGNPEDYHDIIAKFFNKYFKQPDFIEDLFFAVAEDAGLTPGDGINLNGIPGYSSTMTIGDIGKGFSNLIQNWKNAPGNINIATAIMG